MSQTNEATHGNLLLAALTSADRALLDPDMERVKVDREQVFVVPDEPIEHVYFLDGGIASVTSSSAESGATEVGIFGREGMSAPALLLGADRVPHKTFIQVDGTHARRIAAKPFMQAVEGSITLRRLMLRYVQTLLIQTAQSAVANARYQIEARLARWLLMCHDRSDTDELGLTHEFMAMMIGAQRSGVTVSLHILEGSGMIRSKRGRVIILDREKLEELAGDSYGMAEAEYRRMIGPFGRSTEVA